jgi:hypothetical protein
LTTSAPPRGKFTATGSSASFSSVPARGDAEPDYDVAVFLRDMPDRMAELDRLADLRLSFPDETGAFFDAFPYPASACRDGSSLMHEVRREGRDL